MIVSLIIVPLIGALAAFLMPADRYRPWVVAAVAAIHTVLAVEAVRTKMGEAASDWLQLDPLGGLVLLVISTIFLICAMYCIGYLRLRAERPNRVFCTALLGFLAMTSLVALAQHLTVLWVAMEATTLATAVLLYFNQNRRSLEATWKYLMIGSVGIALALLGTLFLAYGALLGLGEPTLLFSELVRRAGHLPAPWVRTAFVFLLVGYGTKMGLAPLHTWKPDAYGEAPGVVGALLAGGLTTGAFLALLRVYRIVDAAGQGLFARELLVVFGLLSMATAAVFMIGQRDFKRLLAYSSVEHMGILVLGIGLGGAGIFAALLHVVNNALTKSLLFLAAGNIHRAFKSKRLEDVTGALQRLPLSAGLFLAGFFAISGSPPFGPFVSELSILTTAMDSHRYLVSALYLILLAVVFIGMGSSVLAVVLGVPPDDTEGRSFRESPFKTIPIIVSLALVIWMGVWIPESVSRLLHAAARLLGGS
ncbi:MAG TPA: proton-conducting transporter membrane subunit [Thermoanaerobaculia bacterium]|jgi:hydrogenase-4 component F|nr:proton-conducting transporter membrane subunit [Thermoanaerobaculia bacterium]